MGLTNIRGEGLPPSRPRTAYAWSECQSFGIDREVENNVNTHGGEQNAEI